MRKPTLRRAAVVAAAGLVLAAGSGAAVAAAQSGDDRDAFLGDVAKRLGVQPRALEDAIEEASKARVDDAVGDGRLTEELAERIKERIEEGAAPILGGPGPALGLRGPGHHVHVDLSAVHEAAARHLGMAEGQLMAARREGISLADLAERRDRTVAGLKNAMRAAAETALARAVADGDLSDDVRDRMVARLDEHLDRMIEGAPLRMRGGRDLGHGFRPPPGGADERATFRAPGRGGVAI